MSELKERKMAVRKRKSSKFKTPQARAGQLGGLLGGPKRAKVLSKQKRKKIATQGAMSRWGGRR